MQAAGAKPEAKDNRVRAGEVRPRTMTEWQRRGRLSTYESTHRRQTLVTTIWCQFATEGMEHGGSRATVDFADGRGLDIGSAGSRQKRRGRAEAPPDPLSCDVTLCVAANSSIFRAPVAASWHAAVVAGHAAAAGAERAAGVAGHAGAAVPERAAAVVAGRAAAAVPERAAVVAEHAAAA